MHGGRLWRQACRSRVTSAALGALAALALVTAVAGCAGGASSGGPSSGGPSSGGGTPSAAASSSATTSPSATAAATAASGLTTASPTAAPNPVVPDAGAIAAAERWLRARGGRTALAVVDTRGRLHGYRVHERFDSASLVKAMLLVAYLRSGAPLTTAWRFRLARMIVASDEPASDAVFAVVGTGGLDRLARAAGMKDFAAAQDWAVSQVTAADQARFFLRARELVPPARRAYADKLLSERGRYRGWGIPKVALLRGWSPYWKDGWIHSPAGELLLQAARLERQGARWSVAVMADGQPDSGYGVRTITGVGERLVPKD